MTVYIVRLILFYSSIYNVDPRIVVAVIDVESSFKVNAVRAGQDFGLMQLNKKYYPQYTAKQLLDPATNIRLGVKHLAEAKRLSVHKNGLDWLTFYNVGYKSNEFKHPSSHKYVKKVRKKMNKFKDGDKVVVKNLYNNQVDGEAIYRGIYKDYPNHSKIEAEQMILKIENERLVEYNVYYEVKK